MAPTRPPSLAIAIAFAMAASASLPAGAVGLGPVVQQSALGQSLRVVIPVVSAEGENVPAECFKLAASERTEDGVPQIMDGRVSLERGPDGARLVVTSPRPVNDPVLRLTMQAGCDTPVRREYTLLMDPPVIEVPVAAADESRSPAVVPSPRAVATPREPAQTPPRRAGRVVRDTRSAAGKQAAEGSRAPRKPAAKPKGGTGVASKRPPAHAGREPRLRLSSAPPSAPGAAARVSPEEAAAAIEAETQVLRQRIAELTVIVERVQQQLKAAEAAERTAQDPAIREPVAAAAQPATQPPAQPATPPAPASPPPPAPGWWESNWPMLAFLVGLPIVIAAALLWRRRQEAAAGRYTPPRVAPDASGPATATRTKTGAGEARALRNAPAGVADGLDTLMHEDTTSRRPTQRELPLALAVSELSHVTEEARVYVALGHVDRAIDVLRQHVTQASQTMPAAWLMLLGLYHSTGRRQDFRKLSEEFHLRCNVQVPLWDGFADAESSGAGLEAFPHVRQKIVARWRKPECRAYLERLLTDNREGRRMGFPIAAYSDILLLVQILDAPPPVDIDSDLARSGRLDLPRGASPSSPGRPADAPRT